MMEPASPCVKENASLLWQQKAGAERDGAHVMMGNKLFHSGAAMLIGGLWAGLMVTTPQVQAASARAATPLHPTVKYMQATAAELLRAQAKPSARRFADIIRRRADVHAIAMYSLGRYKAQLPARQKALYVKGVQQFMARYFADQARKYHVEKAVIEQTPRKSGDNWLVRSKVTLDSGQSYLVTWKLHRTRFGWRVVDVNVMGFSLRFLQKGLFYRFLQKKNGDVNALVMALNR